MLTSSVTIISTLQIYTFFFMCTYFMQIFYAEVRTRFLFLADSYLTQCKLA